MEGGHFESGPRLSVESQEVLSHPEQVFDSDIESARRESEEVRRSLERTGEITRRIEGAEFGSSAGKIRILWPASSDEATFLLLDPITEGKGVETGVLGYIGSYGRARKKDSKWEVLERQSLEELFGVPDNLKIIVRPTVDRWAVGKDPTTALFGENARTLYMGLGFLLLGQEWMYVGMHEAGHLHQGPDENKAWTWANKESARRNRPDKERIIAGESSGQFGILKKPAWYNKAPTIGDLERYGLVSHFMAGNAHIPKHWEKRTETTVRKFKGIIERAQDQYQYAFR